MQTIGSFKLHKKGLEGIEISSEQLSRSIQADNNEIFQDNVNTFRKHQVPQPIIDATERLKFYFLSLTGHWIDLYDPYIDKETGMLHPLPENPKRGHIYLKTLWQSTTVTQVKFSEAFIQIMGTIDVIDDKPLPINPPKITHEDGLEWYMEAGKRIKGIFKLLVQYFSTVPLKTADDYRKYLVANTPEEQKADIASFDDEQVMNKVIDRLSNAGAIIMMDEEIMQTAIAASEPTPEMEPEPDENIAEAVEKIVNSEPEYIPPTEKAPDPFGLPAAEDGKAEPVDPSLEYSSKMGNEDVRDPEDEIPDDEFDL